MTMLDILTIVHSFADIQTASRIRRTCRRLAALTPETTCRVAMYNGATYVYRVGSKLHRLDGPAWENTRRDKYWYREGVCHREYHPQSIGIYRIEYMLRGVYHREVGPSIIYENGMDWYLRGTPHRKIGPAFTRAGGTWYTLGEWHRLDGPTFNDLYAIRGTAHSISILVYGVWIVNGKIIRR